MKVLVQVRLHHYELCLSVAPLLIHLSIHAVSITHHLNSQEPLFKQLVAMGGSSLFMKALPEPVAESASAALLRSLGLSNESTAIQIEKLMSLSAEELLAKTDPSIPMMPTLDGDIIKAQPTFALWRRSDLESQLPGVSWVSRAMLGDCQFDVSLAWEFCCPLC